MTSTDFARGNAHFRKGAYDKAAASYQKAIQQNPGFHLYHYSLAIALHRLDKPDQARAAILQARKLQPENARPWPDLVKPAAAKPSRPALPQNRVAGWHEHQAVKAMLEWVPPNEQALIDAYQASELSEEPDTFALVRIIGNDLVPRHAKGQSRANVRFVLENEPPLKDCMRLWVVNRIFDPEEKQAILDLLEQHQQQYIDLPFVEEDYKNIGWDFECLPAPDYLASQEFQKLEPLQQDRVRTALYRLKNLYLMNNNGARNAALEYGRTKAKWVLPWDGNCFVTQRAWQEILGSVSARGHLKYFAVPMQRVSDNQFLLDDEFTPDPIEEPQILIRRDAQEHFLETFPYGRRPKVELFWRLGIPGPWDRWKDDPWEQPRRPLAEEAGQWGVAGWVARMFSGVAALEKQGDLASFKNRGRVRQEAIIAAIDHVDQLVHFKEKTKPRQCEPIFYDERELERAAKQYKSTTSARLPTVLRTLLAVADKALKEGPYSVTQKTTLPPSGDIRDYWHPAPYWWPNPDAPDGLPYIRKDGERVPGTKMYEEESGKYDRTRLQLMFDNTTALALAWRVTRAHKYAERAAQYIREWFVNEDTRMNPSLTYAQVRLGHNKNQGYESGIIEFKDFYYFLDAVRLTEQAGAFGQEDKHAFREWLYAYLGWLDESIQGRKEIRSINNHGTYFDLQVAAILAYLGESGRLQDVLRRTESRLLTQIDENGVQTDEMKRTLTQHYVFFNLQGLLNVFLLAEKTRVVPVLPNEQSIARLKAAVLWNLSHDQENWPFRQINDFDQDRVKVCIASALQLGLPKSEVPPTARALLDQAGKPILNPHDGVQPFWHFRMDSAKIFSVLLGGDALPRALTFGEGLSDDTAEKGQLLKQLEEAYQNKPQTEADKPHYKITLSSLCSRIDPAVIKNKSELRLFLSALFRIGRYDRIEPVLKNTYSFDLDISEVSWRYALFAAAVLQGKKKIPYLREIQSQMDRGGLRILFGTNPERLLASANSCQIVALSKELRDWVVSDKPIGRLREILAELLPLRGESENNISLYLNVISEIRSYIERDQRNLEAGPEGRADDHVLDEPPQALVFVGGFGWSGSGALFDYLREFDVNLPFGTGELNFFESGRGVDWRNVIAEKSLDCALTFTLETLFGFARSVHGKSGYMSQFKLSVISHAYNDLKLMERLVSAIRDMLPFLFGPNRTESLTPKFGFILFAKMARALSENDRPALFNNVIHGKNAGLLREAPDFVKGYFVGRDLRDAYVARVFDKSLAGTTRLAERIGKNAYYSYAEFQKINCSSVHFIAFEELIADQRLRESITAALGLIKTVKPEKYFDAQASLKNIGVWQSYPGADEIRGIAAWMEKLERDHGLTLRSKSDDNRATSVPADCQSNGISEKPRLDEVEFKINASFPMHKLGIANKTCGYWDMHGYDKGSKLRGVLYTTEASSIYVFVGDYLIKKITPQKKDHGLNFTCDLKNTFIDKVPSGWPVSVVFNNEIVSTKDGRINLPLGGRGEPGRFQEMLAQGYYLSKKGSFILPLSACRDSQSVVLRTYLELNNDFKAVFSYPLLIAHGTLLGLIRENGFIQNDDDFDLFYVSKHSSIEEVVAERKAIARTLLKKGWNIKVSAPSGLLKVGGSSAPIDIMPGWFEGGFFWCLAYTRLDLKQSDLFPPQQLLMEGAPVLVPRNAEKFLEKKYGPHWRNPDPGYRAKRPEGSFPKLNKGRMTRPEAAELNKELRRELAEWKARR